MDMPDASGARRSRRWPRRLVRATIRLVALCTLASLVFNALTRPPRTLTPLDGQDLLVDGRTVHHRHWPGPGRPVVLVHGFAESTASWEPMAGELARTHDVYALDLAGNGYSSYDGHYTLDDQVALVDGYLKALHLERPVLVGHSQGAAVVGGVAARHPSDVGGVIFADGDALPFPNDHGGSSSHAGIVLRLPWTISTYRMVTRWNWLDRRIITQVCGTTCEGLTAEGTDAWVRPMRQGAAEEALPQIIGAGVLHLEAAEISSIKVPRAIIWGEEDATAGGSLALTRTHLHHPPERIIPGAGHLSHLARPRLFAQAVTELVATL